MTSLWCFIVISEKNGIIKYTLRVILLVVLPRDYQETTKTSAEVIKDIMLKDPTISAADIAKKVGLSINGVQYHIKKMKASGEIEREGGDFVGKWKVNL